MQHDLCECSHRTIKKVTIHNEPFKVLYSSCASRANTPVNVCIGALIIKEIFGISDDEVAENLMLDPRYQYALHTTSCEEQPLSDKTLSRFRKRKNCFIPAWQNWSFIFTKMNVMI